MEINKDPHSDTNTDRTISARTQTICRVSNSSSFPTERKLQELLLCICRCVGANAKSWANYRIVRLCCYCWLRVGWYGIDGIVWFQTPSTTSSYGAASDFLRDEGPHIRVFSRLPAEECACRSKGHLRHARVNAAYFDWSRVRPSSGLMYVCTYP